MLLLDATVWVAALRPGEVAHEDALAVIAAGRSAGARLAALDLTLYEVANVATVRAGGPAVGSAAVERIAAICGDRLVRADSRLVQVAVALAAEHGLSVYDAAYVAAARPRAWTLVSCDRDLLAPGFAVAPGELDLPG